MLFKLNIFSKNKILFTNNVSYVKIFNYKNELEIYFNHSPIIFVLKYSIICIYNNINEFFYVYNGILEFNNNKLTILIHDLVFFDNLNITKIKIKIKKIIDKLKKKKYNKFSIKFLYLEKKLLKYNSYLFFLNLIKK